MKKLEIKRVLNALDNKDYDFYKNLTEEEKKEFSPYPLMRFSSNVKGDQDIQEWFLRLTNDSVNKHHWSLSKDHEELLWKLFARIGVGIKCYHPYLAGPKKETNKIENLLCELYPSRKLDDIKVMAKLMTKKECDDLINSMGEMDKKQRKRYE